MPALVRNGRDAGKISCIDLEDIYRYPLQEYPEQHPRRVLMKVEQISVFLENRAGRLAEVTKTLGQAGINIRALSL
ncbi:MAG: ACT domain-containing protein, partial [Desulfohalobiaceae bacterium]